MGETHSHISTYIMLNSHAHGHVHTPAGLAFKSMNSNSYHWMYSNVINLHGRYGINHECMVTPGWSSSYSNLLIQFMKHQLKTTVNYYKDYAGVPVSLKCVAEQQLFTVVNLTNVIRNQMHRFTVAYLLAFLFL